MGIDVYWKSESGEILGTVPDSEILSELSNLLYRQSNSVCLRFIDPAGDACFNQQQLPFLLSEFRQLEAGISVVRAKGHVQRVIQLLEGAAQVHTYIWFIGD